MPEEADLSPTIPGVIDALRNLVRAVFRMGVDPLLAGLSQQLTEIHAEIRTMSTKTDDAIANLKTDVQAQTTVITSVSTFIAGLSTQLATALASAKDAGATDEQLAELTDLDASVKANNAALAAAVAAGTPAAADASGAATGGATQSNAASAGSDAGTTATAAQAADPNAPTGQQTII